ncbi:MAG: UDP-2,3-diacylglucosamine diphosphatase [Muribaculaceae bacterium]|nr:UDP-2,3-diacylglucosamine diphosphatase [Muribaculaceae bacterium]
MSADSRRDLTYFLSDIHLGAGYMPDRIAHEKHVVAFLRQIAPRAARLYLLGDILDYWFEYRTVVPRGYVRFFGQLAAMADAGTEIVWFIGNHDIWLFDYLRDELGIKVVDSADGGIPVDIGGVHFFLGHGDTFGRQPAPYRMLRSIFHNRVLQKLYSAIHPRWTIPFAHGWSSHSRKGNSATVPKPVFGAKARAATEVFARRLSADDPGLRYIIIGHHHVALDEPVNDHCRLIILGNWIDRSTYAVFDGTTLQLKEWDGSPYAPEPQPHGGGENK